MLVDDSKIFLCGLPLDCQEDTLKNFLEGACDNPGAVTKVSIPDKKSFAFVTLSCTEVAKRLLGITLLYCDGVGQLYQVKACPYVKQPFRKKMMQDYKPKTKPYTTFMEITEPKAVKYQPPDHVHQFTPDYRMLSHSKPKRRKRKRDDLAVWLGDVGSTSFRKRPRQKKKKKKASKLELHKTESFQFGNLCPESKATTTNIEDITDTTGVVEPVVHENGQRLSKATTTNIESTSNTTGNVEPVVHENGQRLSIAISTDIEETTNTTGAVEPVVHGNGQRLSNAMTTNIEDTSDTRGVVEPIEGKIPAVEVVCADGQKTSSTISSHTQVIIDHDYLGPLCLQFTSPPSVADVKNELMERTGLPVKDQLLYYNGKKLSDSLALRPMIDDNPDSLTLVLSVGTLKGGVRPKKAPDEGATGSQDPSSSQGQDCSQGRCQDGFTANPESTQAGPSGESTDTPGNDNKDDRAPDTGVNEETSAKVAIASVNVVVASPVVKGPAGKIFEFFEGMKQHFRNLYGEWGKDDNGTIMCPPFFERDYISPSGDVPGAAPLKDMVLETIKGDDAEKEVFDILEELGEETKQPMFVLSKLKFTEFIKYCLHQQLVDELPKQFPLEVDFVIVHLNIGVILFEVKADHNWPGEKAKEQLRDREKIVKGLLPGESGIPVYKVIALPNMDGTGYCKDGFISIKKADVGSCNKFSRWMEVHFDADKCGSQEKQELLTLLYKLVGQRTVVDSSLETEPIQFSDHEVHPAKVISKKTKNIYRQNCLKGSFEMENAKKGEKERKADGSESCLGPHQTVVKTADRLDLAELAKQVVFLNVEQLRVWKGPCHQLISGVSGSGKTILLQCRALECARKGEKVIICVPTPLYKLYEDFFKRDRKNKKAISSRVNIYTFEGFHEFLPENEEKFHLFVDELQILCAHPTNKAYLNELMRKQKSPDKCFCWFAYDDTQFITLRNSLYVSSTVKNPVDIENIAIIDTLPSDEDINIGTDKFSSSSHSYYFARTNSYILQLGLSQSHQFGKPASPLKTAMRSTEQVFKFVSNFAEESGIYVHSIKSKESHHRQFNHSVPASMAEDWQVKIGHRVCGPPVKKHACTASTLADDVGEIINTEVEMWGLRKVAVLVTDEVYVKYLSDKCKSLGIEVCGVGENKYALVLDHGGNVHSYEWPVVIAVCQTESEPVLCHLIFSRAVIRLIVVKESDEVKSPQETRDYWWQESDERKSSQEMMDHLQQMFAY